MCIGSSPKPLPPPPPPPIDVPVTPMQSPEDSPTSDTTGKLRKAKGRRGLKIDLDSGSSESGLSIPL